MYSDISVSSDIPATKLRRATKTGVLSLTKEQLLGSGATLSVHPETAMKVQKAKKANRGVRLLITPHEIAYPMVALNGGGMHGASVWGKIWDGIKTGAKFLKNSGLLTAAADALVAPATAFTGSPAAVMAARQGLKKLTGVGITTSVGAQPLRSSATNDVRGRQILEPSYERPVSQQQLITLEQDEGGKLTFADVKSAGTKALSYAKRKGLLTDAVDLVESKLVEKATKPEHVDMIKSIRKGVKARYGVGVQQPAQKKKLVKGSPEAKEAMAALRAKRKKPMVAGSFRLN